MQKNASCQGCHGIDGFRTAYPEVYSVPMIGGQSETYLINALKAYRSGDRTHPGMRAIALHYLIKIYLIWLHIIHLIKETNFKG